MKPYSKALLICAVALASVAATVKISNMTVASSIADVDIIPIVQGGSNKAVTFLNVKSNILNTATNAFAVSGSVGLFYGGTQSINVTNLGITASYNGQLIVNNTTDASSDIFLPDDMTDAFPIGGYCYVYYPLLTGAAGTVVGSATVTRYGSGLNIGGQYALIKCYKVSANTWHVEGDLTIP
jgi:hypothetical protein